jgi:hypothetical protein
MKNRIPARAWFRPVLGLGSLGTVALGVGWLFGQQMPPVLAQTPPPAQTAPAAPEANPDYNNRVVAYIYDNTPITREELGEYLIARYGTEKLDLLINKKIIEHACKERGIDVSAAEVDADIDNTINGLGGVDRKTFIEKVLSARHLSLYEWREDVVRPRLLLTKLCRDRVKIEQKDIEEAFEMHYGEKIDAQVIIYPTGMQSHDLAKVYDKIRGSADEFDREARQQSDANLARTAGHIKPISRHTCPQLEQAAFRLKPGEISEMIETPEGIVVIKCLSRLPAEKGKSIDKEREALTKEVTEKKVAQMIPTIFKELLAEAKPNSLMKASVKNEAELKKWTEQELKPNSKGAATPPLGH